MAPSTPTTITIINRFNNKIVSHHSQSNGRDHVGVPIHALHYFDCESPLTNNDATSADDSRYNAQSSKVVNGDSQSVEQWQEIFSGTVSFALFVSSHSQTSVTGDDFVKNNRPGLLRL